MKRLITSFLGILIALSVRANEGMWLPFLLENNIGEMSEMGLHLTADDIYNINQQCLSSAVVGFVDLDRPYSHFCSGSVISAQGLVITNHHCGLSVVQQHSSLENDYITNGFWAMNQADELGGNDIGVCFLRRMEDVTAQVLEGVSDTMTIKRRNEVINSNISQIESKVSDSTGLKAHVDAFYCYNEYYLSVYEIFEDVRLVGTPPISVGKFGGDTDNWVWPRHTGDFTIFRIYADSLNRPAKYSAENVPYRASNYLKINAKEKREGDFVMLMGYPGTTNEYLPSFAVAATQDVYDPIVVSARGKSIDIIKERMRADKAVMIKYTSKVASLANAWKKLDGERRGLAAKRVVEKKRERERLMREWVAADPQRKAKYETLLDDYAKEYSVYQKYRRAKLQIDETFYKSEMIDLCSDIRTVLQGNSTDEEKHAKIIGWLRDFYADYDLKTDQLVTQMLELEYLENADTLYVPNSLRGAVGFIGGLTGKLLQKSLLADSTKAFATFRNYTQKSRKKIENDPLFKFTAEIDAVYSNIKTPMQKSLKKTDDFQRQFMQLQRECFADKRFFPDANSTFRVAYGQISGYRPTDAVSYAPFTTLGGVIEKCDLDVYDYTVPDRLKQLSAARDFGPYCNADSSLTVCFISTCHTTGGNSGSPAFDADGNLIGLNFDRVWEGTMSDLQFDADICRNICLDIRFVLFFIDKYAGARHLIDEMELVND
ncbi:MAG: S46 family peptidase [Salinivirgaceae bacterium]|nr:S46 family peptidase [Salinivirgaceae bacterium]